MICGNASDFIDHPIPYLNILYPHMGPPTTPGPQAPHHLNPGLVILRNKPSYYYNPSCEFLFKRTVFSHLNVQALTPHRCAQQHQVLFK